MLHLLTDEHNQHDNGDTSRAPDHNHAAAVLHHEVPKSIPDEVSAFTSRLLDIDQDIRQLEAKLAASEQGNANKQTRIEYLERQIELYVMPLTYMLLCEANARMLKDWKVRTKHLGRGRKDVTTLKANLEGLEYQLIISLYYIARLHVLYIWKYAMFLLCMFLSVYTSCCPCIYDPTSAMICILMRTTRLLTELVRHRAFKVCISQFRRDPE